MNDRSPSPGGGRVEEAPRGDGLLGLMACPGCGSHNVVAEMSSRASVPVGGIERGAVGIYLNFDATEWEVEDVFCEECDWQAQRGDYSDYEWLADHPPEGQS